MPHKVKAILFFLFLIFCSNCAKVDREKFENLYRAGKAFGGATKVGVKYERFGELLQNLATEITIASEKATFQKEKEMIKSYRVILEIYKDSHLVWKFKIKTPKIDGLPSDLIIIKPEIKYVVKKYSLKLRTGTLQKRGWTVVEDTDLEMIPEDSIQKIWIIADKLLEETNKKYFGY